jgi:hypothetical protein
MNFEQLQAFQLELYGEYVSVVAGPFSATDGYSYPSFPYIPALFFRSTNPYFTPPSGYYSGYSPAHGYYCLPYPQTNAPVLPGYGSTPRRAPSSLDRSDEQTYKPTNHSSLANISNTRQYE